MQLPGYRPWLPSLPLPIVEREIGTLLEHDRAWHEERLPLVEDRVRVRLNDLSARLGDADWLDGEFSAGDLLMVTVLERLKGSGMLDEYPNLSAYVGRGEARPAFQRAFDAQLAVFTGRPVLSQRRRTRGARVRRHRARAQEVSSRRSCSLRRFSNSTCQRERCTAGATCTAVTLYSGQFVAQSLYSVVTTFAPVSGSWKVV